MNVRDYMEMSNVATQHRKRRKRPSEFEKQFDIQMIKDDDDNVWNHFFLENNIPVMEWPESHELKAWCSWFIGTHLYGIAVQTADNRFPNNDTAPWSVRGARLTNILLDMDVEGAEKCLRLTHTNMWRDGERFFPNPFSRNAVTMRKDFYKNRHQYQLSDGWFGI